MQNPAGVGWFSLGTGVSFNNVQRCHLNANISPFNLSSFRSNKYCIFQKVTIHLLLAANFMYTYKIVSLIEMNVALKNLKFNFRVKIYLC